MSDKVEQIVNDKVKQIAEDLVALSVKDVRDLQELLKEKYGIEPYAPTVVGNVDNAGASSSAGAEKSSFTVVLKSVGASKLNVIKALKEVLGLGLAEAKAITDSVFTIFIIFVLFSLKCFYRISSKRNKKRCF